MLTKRAKLTRKKLHDKNNHQDRWQPEGGDIYLSMSYKKQVNTVKECDYK